MALTDNDLGLELILTSISRYTQNMRDGKRLPNGEFSCRRTAKGSSTSVELDLGSIWPCRFRGSTLNAVLIELIDLESTSVGTGGALNFAVETLHASLSYRFVR